MTDTLNSAEQARRFASLHVPGDPLVLFNIWDPGSAKAVAKTGAKAIATGSWSVAEAHGRADAEDLPLALVLGNLGRITEAVDRPVTLDFEGGYGLEPDGVAANFQSVLDAGAVGVNFEDRIIGGSGLHETGLQAARIRAMRAKADELGIPAWINARTDIFLQAKPETHDAAMVDAALERARAYASAGGSSLFLPGLVDEALIGRACEGSPLPVNIMFAPVSPPKAKLAELGVARISHGPFPYRAMLKWLAGEAEKALA